MGNETRPEEISIGGGLTTTGIKASVKSRGLSAWDRLWGAKADKRRVPIDADIAEASALSNARVKMINALGDMAIDRLKTDPEFAARAVDTFIPQALRRQDNKDGILEFAIEDLRQNPGTEEDAASGPDHLSETFLNRFERYAEDASEEEVREKWGKVLASEIRKPGTFSPKVMRVVDELDGATAKTFEDLCRFRMAGTILKPLSGELDFESTSRLVASGLVHMQGLGQAIVASEATDQSGAALWFWGFGKIAVAATKTPKSPVSNTVILIENGKPAIPVYSLTDVGLAISSILPDYSEKNLDRIASVLSKHMPNSEIRCYDRSAQDQHWRPTRKIPPSEPPSPAKPR
jgi:hypothetical protein